MNLSAGLITGFSWWLCAILYAVMLMLALFRSPWKLLFNNRDLQHLFLGAFVCLSVLWLMRAGLSDGLMIHFLGATAVTLLLGWDLALLVTSMALIVMVVGEREVWQGFPVVAVCTGVIPVLTAYFSHRLIQRWFNNHFVAYLLGAVFFGAGLSIGAFALSVYLLMVLNGIYTHEQLVYEFIVFTPLLFIAEALMNGIIVSGFAVNHPHLVRTLSGPDSPLS